MSSPFVPSTLAVYHNLLILEASFRRTYLQLRARRRNIAYPSRYVQQTNKAMRLFNIRLVITPVPFFQFRKPLDQGVHLVLSNKRFDILVIEGWEAFRTAYLTSEQRRQKRKRKFRKSSASPLASASTAPSFPVTQKSKISSPQSHNKRETLANSPQSNSSSEYSSPKKPTFSQTHSSDGSNSDLAHLSSPSFYERPEVLLRKR
ncbi:Nem1-Spo7 complex regulatory subunit Spo7 [Schizosaccharomyces cryophilus OY26]|uniref:Nem1-Spo7 complex regulatory subunit Spo7 n=1 Tax=Schizosaccharomyces cryophilus (strain OY26 / ATCC MYA-4695 / CBS 11777 / NBRC 106824 / NRRL Y48691) TaxID=653667 RepID=S9X0M2_SCHCR|nr:Nem1-Spo7 complex regulatory subunit Spo7 [Schizosaccharomyces cryophilus OY26]EPY50522.1 Nem1-Spo7 complex regulatory subunit Spo7 [Schizosaccharomyces cryophilus OY26]